MQGAREFGAGSRHDRNTGSCLAEARCAFQREADTVTQIVIVGGGAGGLELATKLGRRYRRNPDVDVLLVDRHRTHVWKPLLHEVAAGSLDANLDEVGYGAHGHRWGFPVFLGTFEDIDRDSREIVIAPMRDDDGTELLARQRIPYDYLIMAVGSVSNDFGTPGVRSHCVFLDERGDAEKFRQRLLDHCLRVSRVHAMPEADSPQVQTVIVGGGATGVELAAELYDAAGALRHYGLEGFDESRLRVTLIEAGPRILPALPEKLAAAAHEELESLGVRILVDTRVTEVDRTRVHTGADETFAADIRVWAAGIQGAEYLQGLGGLETTRSNRLVVTPTLQTTRDERIFALGDCCACPRVDSEDLVPPRAQAAHQMADAVLANLRRILAGKPPAPYVYRDYGSLVSLSRFSTVGSLMGKLVGGRMAVEGRLARLVYLSLYRMHLIAIHGWFRGLLLIAIGHVNRVVRPRLKLH